MMRLLLASLVMAAVSTSAHAAENYERMLLPLVISVQQGIPGAEGSRWRTFLVGRNESDEFVHVTQTPDNTCPVLCPPQTAQPRSSFVPDIFPSPSVPAAFVYVEARNASHVYLQLRAQDLSRQAATWGTEIPIVREQDFKATSFQLLDIPVTPEFRQTLRIYGWGLDNGAPVRVRVFSQEDQTLYAERTLWLAGETGDSQHLPMVPAFAQILHIGGELLPGEPVSRVRIEVTPAREGLRIWAFVSVTNNVTQHVTTVTPR
jgi:hypothetical protein